jgi:hypothetical protein
MLYIYTSTSTVEAFQWTGDENQLEDPLWFNNILANNQAAILNNPFTGELKMFIATPSGEITAAPGDYIIHSPLNACQSCMKKEVFEARYTALNGPE